MVRAILTTLTSLLLSAGAFAQCFEVLDGNGTPSPNPYFISCTPGTYTLILQTNQALGPYTVDWGDGTPIASGASLVPPAFLSHTYAAATDTFNVVITETSTSCVVNGVVVLERNPLASIQLPSGDDNFGCTPVQFRFINSSTQISQTTTFTWDFGDGSPIEVYDFTNLGDTILHTYLPGIGVQSCDLEVRLTAENYCGTSTASFFPLKVWDLDEAVIDASATLLCYPDTVVQYTNQTIRNCFPEGNNSQRYELWNFGDYWGLGRDSIIGWRPWNPPIINPPPIAYPGVGIYTATLIDSSFCGLDATTIQIEITNPPTAIINSNRDTICEGETVTFTNNSIGGSNEFFWDFDRGAGFQNLNGNPKNRAYNNSGDYVIRLVAGIAGANGCSDTAQVPLHVLPSPVADFNFDNNNDCDSMFVNFTDASTGNINDWQWDFDNGNTFNGQNPPTQFYASPGTYNVRLIVSGLDGCINNITQQIRVRETPVADFDAPAVCLNLPANFVDQSLFTVDPITSYRWFFGDGDSSDLQDPTHIYTSSGTFQVTLIVNNGFCSDTNVQTFVVEDPPIPDFAKDTSSGCSPLTVNFTNNSSANSQSFRWSFGDGSAIDTNRNPSHVFVNNSSNDTTFYLRMIATTAFGCVDTTFDSVLISPVPVPQFTSDAVLDCGPITVNFTNNTQGDSLNFEWNFGDGSPPNFQRDPTHIFNNNTLFISNYEVELIVTSTNNCTDTARQTITVYPEPNFTFGISPDSGCSPLRVRFPSVVGAVSYQWDFGDGSFASGPTPTHTFINNTTNDQVFTVQLIAQNTFGCLDTTSGNVLVYPNPTADFALDTNVGCQPFQVNITNNSTGANTFNWNFGDGTSSSTASAIFPKTYTNTGGVASFNTIQLIAETNQGCRDTTSRQVEVHPFIEAAFFSDTAGCSPFPVNYLNQSVGASAYIWDFGDNTSSSAVSPSNTFRNDSSFTLQFNTQMIATSPEGCLDTAEQLITVFPKPRSIFTVNDSVGCQPLPVTFTNLSQLADSCYWRFGDGTDSASCVGAIPKTYTNTTSFLPINYQAQLFTFTDEGCRDTSQKTITVNPRVAADFDSDTAGCSPLTVDFRSQATGASNFEWLFGDGSASTLADPRHIFVNFSQTDTIFTTQLKVISQYGCADSLSRDIEVFAQPQADFTVNVNQGCQPLEVTFTNQSTNRDSCAWNFGDGNTLSSCANLVDYTYLNQTSLLPVDYQATLTVYTDNGCTSSFDRNIRVNPQVTADFLVQADSCSPVEATFRSQSFGASTYDWDFGDGGFSGGLITSNRYINNGSTDTTFTVRLIATSIYNCADTIEQQITVGPTPVPDFTLNPLQQKFPNATVNFTNTTSAGNWTYRWDFGDSTISLLQNPGSHTYGTWGDFLVKLVASSSFCSDSITKVARILVPDPIADFTDSASGCEPLEVQFQSNSLYARSFLWDFGDGTTSNAENPAHLFFGEGEYNVTLTVTGFEQGLTDQERKLSYIKVYKTPRASAFANKDEVFIPNDPVVFTNTSFNADSYLWNFGDGGTSTEQSPVYNYQSQGEYQVTLIANTDFGCTDTFRLPNTVFAQLEGRLNVPNAFTPNPNGPNSGRINPGSRADLNDVFYAKMNGVSNYELNIFNKWGELIFVSKDQNIGWNGYYRGELCKQDVYVWKIKAEFVDGKQVVEVGDLMLLR